MLLICTYWKTLKHALIGIPILNVLNMQSYAYKCKLFYFILTNSMRLTKFLDFRRKFNIGSTIKVQ